jgi:hypothetical protein
MSLLPTDPNESPEHMIERIKRRRTANLILLLVGLAGAIVVGIGATALMYSGGPKTPVTAAAP